MTTVHLQALSLRFRLRLPSQWLKGIETPLICPFLTQPRKVVSHDMEIRPPRTPPRVRPRHGQETAHIHVDGRIYYRHIPLEDISPYLDSLMQRLVVAGYQNTRDYCLIHSATVTKGQQGVLICGKSGCGKSSLALALLKNHRFQYLTDEMTCWNARKQKVVAYPKTIVLKEKGLRPFSQRQEKFPSTMWDTESVGRDLWHVDPVTVAEGRIRKTTPIRWIIFPTFQATRHFEIKRISNGQAIANVHTQRFDGRIFDQSDFEKLVRLTQGASAYTMIYHDVFAAAQCIAELTDTRSRK